MSRTRVFVHNMIASAVLQVFNMASGIIVPRIMLVYYGSEINGLVSSIVQFISYFNIVEAGLGGAVIFSLYKPLAEKNIIAVSNIVTAAKKLYYKTGILFSTLVLALAFTYPMLVNVADMGYMHIAFLVAVLGASGVMDFFVMAKYTTLFTADQRLYVISLANCFEVVLTTLLVFVLARVHADIVLLRLAVVVIIFVKAGIIRWYAYRHYKKINYSSPEPDYTALGKRWDVLYLQLLNAVQTATPVVLLTLLAGDLKLVSVYVVYNMVIAGVNGILGIFMNGLQSGFGEIIAKGEIKTLQKAYSEFEFMYYNLIGIAFTVTFLTIQPFIKLYTAGISDTDYNLPVVAALFVINALLYNIKTPQGMLVLSAGLYKETRVQTTLQGAIGLLFGCAFIMLGYGIEGVLCGAMLSNIFRDCEIPYFVSKNVTHLRSAKSYARMIFTLFVFAAVINIVPNINIDISINTYFDWLLYLVHVLMVSIILFGLSAIIYDFTQVRSILKSCRAKIT